MKMNYLSTLFAVLFIVSCTQSKKEEAQPGKNTAPGKNASERTYELAPVTGKIEGEPYEILATHHSTTVKNFHVLVRDVKTDSASLQKFADKFREKYCELQCNILLYDDKSVMPLVTKYPLSDEEYVRLADHYIGSSAFEVTGIEMYPLKDDRYKSLKKQ